MPYRDLMTKRMRDRAYQAVRRASDPEGYQAAARVRVRRHRRRSPDYYRNYGKAWRKSNPNYHPERARKRRARLAQVLTTLTAEQWEAILELAGGACIYCGSREQLTQDHLTPLSRGGNHTAENVAPACGPCNSSKGAQVVAEFLAEKES